MREYSTPLTVDLPGSGNLTDDVVDNGQSHPDAVSFSRRSATGWSDITASEFLQDVRAVAKGLLASGICIGDRVAIISRTRYEWTLTDYAIWFVGAVTVPIYETSTAEQIEWILTNSGARAVVAETPEHVSRIEKGAGNLAEPLSIWSLDEDAVGFLRASGTDVADHELESRRKASGPTSLATIIYTSGTTGRPRGCMLTHGNVMFALGTAVEALPELFGREAASTLAFLPLPHVFARILQVGAVRARVRLGYSSEFKQLLDDLESFGPTFVLAVPRVFERLFNTVSQRAAADGRGKTFDRSAETAIAYSRAMDMGKPGVALRVKHAVYDRLVYRKLRTALGGRCEYAVSGGAPIGERLGHFYQGVGLVLLEGYGLTEATAALTVNLPETAKIGSAGRPLPGTTIRVADDGELLAKGGQLFSGYWKDEDATSAVISTEGWLHTGDLGEIDDEGFVRVTGRKEEIIVTAGGKNVAPSVLEDRVRAHSLVSQCMVVGDGQAYIAALITLDPENLGSWVEQHGKSADVLQLIEDAELIAEIQTAIDDANGAVSRAEAIRKFTILTLDWTEESGHLTPSLKLKRNVVLRDFYRDVAALHAS